MESVYLKTFIEVASTGNLTRAADNLNVTPSAVSRRIKFIEEQYGYELLDRTAPVLVPTEAGALVLEKAKQLIRIEKELLSGLSNIRKPPRFSFCCTPAFGIAHLPEVLRRFMLVNAEMNNMEFHFDMPEKLVGALKENLFDLAVIEHCECLDLSGFATLQLPEDEMIFVCPPRLFPNPQDVTIDDLLPQTLYSRKEGCCSRKFLDLNLGRIGRNACEFGKIIVYDDLHIIVDSVTRGDGIAYLSKSLVADKIADGALAGLHMEGFLDRKRRTFVMNGDIEQEGAAIRFASELLGYFGLPGASAVLAVSAAS